MNRLFKYLFLHFMKSGYSKSKSNMKAAYLLQKENYDKLIKIIGDIAIANVLTDGKLSLNASEKRRLRRKTSKSIITLLKKETSLERKLIKSNLSDITSERYLQQSYLYNIGLNWNISILSEDKLKEIVFRNFEGENWEKRVVKNKRKTARDLKKHVNDFLMGRTTPQEIKKQIKKKYGFNAFETHRLVETEVNRCMNEACEEFAEEHGIQYQMYSATLDRHTCEECREDDGKVFAIHDPSKPTLPRHPLDRCCYIDLPSENWRPKTRRDNENKKTIPNITYNNWRKEYVKE